MKSMTVLHGLSASPDEVEVEYQASMTDFDGDSINAKLSHFFIVIQYLQ